MMALLNLIWKPKSSVGARKNLDIPVAGSTKLISPAPKKSTPVIKFIEGIGWVPTRVFFVEMTSREPKKESLVLEYLINGHANVRKEDLAASKIDTEYIDQIGIDHGQYYDIKKGLAEKGLAYFKLHMNV